MLLQQTELKSGRSGAPVESNANHHKHTLAQPTQARMTRLQDALKCALRWQHMCTAYAMRRLNTNPYLLDECCKVAVDAGDVHRQARGLQPAPALLHPACHSMKHAAFNSG